MTARRILVVIAKVAAVAAGLAYAIWNVEPAAVAARLAGADPWLVLASLAASLVAYACIGVRLHVLVERRSRVGACIAAGLLAFGINNVVPARVGELAKAVYLAARSGLATGRVLGLVFWERLLDLNAVLVLAVVALASLSRPGALAIVAAAALGGWALVAALRIWREATDRLIARLPWARAAALIGELARGIRQGVGARDLALRLAPLTAAIWILFALEVGLAVLATGVPITLGQMLAVQVAIAIGFAVPVAPGGLGIAEAAMVFTLATFGVGKEDALAAAIVVRAVQYVPTTVAAGVILLVTDVPMPGARRRGRGNAG